MPEAIAHDPLHPAAHGDPHVAHQFDDAAQQRAAATLGMWTFLATEVMFFGGLFLIYTVYRGAYPEGFREASGHLSVWMGGINTVILLTSSYTMALAVHWAREGDNARVVRYLLLTIAFGTVFLVLKGFEYAHEFQVGLVPGRFFTYESALGPTVTEHVHLFFILYFIMTGLHALHMIIGLAIIGVLAYMARRGRFTRDYNTPVDMIGLYWHFVDIVWIFLFPLLYLIH